MLLQVGEIVVKINFKLDGMKELEKGFKKLGDVPQRHITTAVRKSMRPIWKEAQSKAPYLTGDLEKGTIMAGERAKDRGKKVYRIVFDKEMNHLFQKPNKEGKITGYYPISQEYGFFARNGKYIHGISFIRESFRSNIKGFEKDVMKDMKEKIDNELRKSGWL